MAMQTRSRISRCAAVVALSVSIACAASVASAAGVATGQTRPDKATQMLFDAVHTNDFAAAEAAVAAGADVEARDRWDISPVELAVDKGYFRIAHFLVSVRNSRTPAAEVASRAPTQPARAAAPAQAQAAANLAKKAASVPANAAPQPQQLAAQPQWPAGTPNPFDPAAPAFGTALPVIPATRPTAADAADGGDGPMLANDEAVERKGRTVR
ncbi:MAG: hypothetical protein U0S49_15550 [Rhodospirillales bacterium]|nr:hypothetical protein [Rhodospirillales bacterium]